MLKNKRNMDKTLLMKSGIDVLVYHFYNLTYEDAKVIDPALTEEEWKRK